MVKMSFLDLCQSKLLSGDPVGKGNRFTFINDAGHMIKMNAAPIHNKTLSLLLKTD